MEDIRTELIKMTSSCVVEVQLCNTSIPPDVIMYKNCAGAVSVL